MNAEFVALVRRMRDAQKAYFKTRNSTALELSKSLEREVDKRIEKMLDPQKELLD